MRNVIFNALRLYVALERPFRTFIRWCKGEAPDVIVEPLTLPEGEIPEVHDATPVFLDASFDRAYAPDRNGKTLRRVAQTEEGEIVYLSKRPKSERRAEERAQNRAKVRAKRVNGHSTAEISRA